MYKINSFSFEILNPSHIIMPDNISKFYVDSHEYQYLYELTVVDKISVKEDKFTLSKGNIKICLNNSLEKRYLYITGDTTPYAVCEEINESYSIVRINKRYVYSMCIDTMFVSLLSLERRMNTFHQYVLHSAYIMYQDKAILFSAPSGVGKSTQASLWQKYKDAFLVNGDRTLISKENHQYYANGWPICGSSEICFNLKYPLCSIVILSQGNKNQVEELSYKESVKKLLSELTVNYHNKAFVDEIMNFIEDLVSHIKIYHLTCDISENAVHCLEERLKNDGCFR